MSRLHTRPENHTVSRIGWLLAAVIGVQLLISRTAMMFTLQDLPLAAKVTN